MLSTTLDRLDWDRYRPRFQDLQQATLTPAMVGGWLREWSDAERLVWEARAHLKRDTLRDQRDDAARLAFQRFVEEVLTPFRVAVQSLTEKLLAVQGYKPPADQVQMLRRMRNQAGLFRPDNARAEAAISRLTGEYAKLAASMAPALRGRPATGGELERLAREPDRAAREEAWRAAHEPWMWASAQVDRLFLDMVRHRREIAAEAGLPDYRAYRWRELDRLDYSPADALGFLDAIGAELTPLAARLFEARRSRLGVATLRPWDLLVSPDAPSGQPYETTAAFEEGLAAMCQGVAPEMGAMVARMRDGFLDLGWRPGKRSGGEEWYFPVTGLPYVHLDAGGTDEGVQLALHECGHALHDHVIRVRGGLTWDWHYPSEMSELASIAMTHLAAPSLVRGRGGPYSLDDAARIRRRELEEIVLRWLPLIAQAEAFQHWLYGEAPEDVSPSELDAAWERATSRFMPWIDWSGLEAKRALGWRRSWLIVTMPLYNLEYGVAHLGALQVARLARANYQAAWRAFRSALELGATAPLPALYRTAGARLPFNRSSVRDAVGYLAALL